MSLICKLCHMPFTDKDRFAEHVKAGGPVKKFEPMPLQSQAERQAEADKAKGETSLTTGKPVLGPHLAPLVKLLVGINETFPRPE